MGLNPRNPLVFTLKMNQGILLYYPLILNYL